MYRSAPFIETDPSALDALLARDSFITLVTVRDGEPTVSHLPALHSRDGDRIELCGHWARPNPQAKHAGPALAIVHGPHAYISPSWYTDKESAARVPTWNYAVAHLHGRLETFDDTESLAALVAALSDRYEAAAGSDWRFEPERDDQRVQLRGIIGFRFIVERSEVTFKLNQNHPAANRRAVAERLDMQARGGSHEIAALMRERTPAGD
jgi:transcriptional regulator